MQCEDLEAIAHEAMSRIPHILLPFMNALWKPSSTMEPMTDMATVKYSAFMRKQTRYNPTRGGTFSVAIGWPTTHLNLADLLRTLPLPCSLQDVLANRPRHDSPQDRPR
jgi:hypothetical protein